MNSAEIRSRFVDYFKRNGHADLPSSSLVPTDDPTLLFTNAGMVQFKSIFTGEREREVARAVTVQKCLRVSGKHNDLEDVGVTSRHHTFFEMLGNFSFGDYFKAEAISYAWEYVTDELGLDVDRLWATVHDSDEEAYTLWLERSTLPPERVLRLGDKENFWQMGETGPCGPCSELHYDVRPAAAPRRLSSEGFLAAGKADGFMEIWNLVFMQFERVEGAEDRPLPAPSIDTGAGLERIAAVLQNVGSTYHTDLFLPIIARAEDVLGREYPREPERWEEGLPFRVLADHARAVAFLLADGVFPSNEGRGYVLRRILRRAARHAWLLGRREPTLDKLVETVVEEMASAYPELRARQDHLVLTTRAEEDRFLSTIEEGMRRFDEVAPTGGGGTIRGEEAFRLYDTFGFPLDLTELMAAERGYEVDAAGFERALLEQRERSRGGRLVSAELGDRLAFAEELERGVETDLEQEFVGYERLEVETRVLGYAADDGWRALVLAENPFYVEAGGQVSDRGSVRGDGWEMEVQRVVRNEEGQTVVAGPLSRGRLEVAPSEVLAVVDERTRRDTEGNHTATHLLHAALRSALGEHVHQAGSLVAPDRLRFDFTHRGPLTLGERRAIERSVNEAIWANAPVLAEHKAYQKAIDEGAMALFGEKYGDEVRVIRVPGVSAELCGGTHVRSTGQIGLFKIVGETGVAAGIRRIEAVTGPGAYERVLQGEEELGRLSEHLRVGRAELERAVTALIEERDRLEAAAAGRRQEGAAEQAKRLVASGVELSGGILAQGEVELSEGTNLGDFGDLLREQLGAKGSGAAIVCVRFSEGEKRAFLSVVTDDWIRKGVHAGELVRVASTSTGSSGGGRPHLAQGGVGSHERVAEALEKASQAVRASLDGGSS
ncbi:MAG: alanine--tRNA ligase [Gemmatimonadetes bacterium]|nr:alanine--tRNA ligase [Gemmatimonadota bacterium]